MHIIPLTLRAHGIMTAERPLYQVMAPRRDGGDANYTIHAVRSWYNNRKSGYYRFILSTGLRPCAYYTTHAMRSWYNVSKLTFGHIKRILSAERASCCIAATDSFGWYYKAAIIPGDGPTPGRREANDTKDSMSRLTALRRTKKSAYNCKMNSSTKKFFAKVRWLL